MVTLSSLSHIYMHTQATFTTSHSQKKKKRKELKIYDINAKHTHIFSQSRG